MTVSKILSYPFVWMIYLYQMLISPLFPSACRHHPSCSQYMKEALKKHGLFKGLSLGIKRIATCHPGGKGGYDPVP